MTGPLQKNKLSILMPLYNEEEFVDTCIRRVMAVNLPDGLSREIVVVDDGSTDSSVEIIETLAKEFPGMIRLYRQPHNQGKGAAIRRAVEMATGEYCIIQDADLEYDPQDYQQVISPLLHRQADAVYGSRFASPDCRKVLLFWHSLANYVLTLFCNLAADLNLTDMESCYKAFRTSLIQSIPLRSNRFGFEPEITIKLSQRRVNIYEVPISYHGRSYEDGKKIGLKDAIEAFWLIFRFGLTKDIYKDDDQAILDTLSETPRFNRWMADTIRPYVGKRVLELGAGIGNITQQLAKKREHYTATDIDEEHMARMRTRFTGRGKISIHRCDLTNPADFAQFRNSMDSIVCMNVLEHVEPDNVGLANLYSALQPGGCAIVLVPQGMAVYGTLDKVLGHFRRYSEAELKGKMETAGFQVEKVLKFNRMTYPAWFVNGRIFKKTRFSRFQLYIFDHMVWLWRLLDPILPWPPASIIGIGRKPAA